MTRTFRKTWLVLILLVGAAGCGGGPKLYPVHGKVVYPDGSPFKGGAVMFEPVENKLNIMSKGTIKSDGTYSLSTYKEGDGAMEGRYRVVVRGRRPNPKSTAPVDPELVDQLHPRFLDFKTSGLEFTVEPSSNDFEIKIEKAPKSRS